MCSPALARRCFKKGGMASNSPVIPASNRHPSPPTVIPPPYRHSDVPNRHFPLPSFRRKPESAVAGFITVVADYDARFRLSPE